MDDGSVYEIGNISSLSTNNNTVNNTKQSKSCIGKWITLVSWIGLIIVCISFFVQHESANDYIIYCEERIFDLEQQVNLLQSELNSKSGELDSINQQVFQETQNRIPITVTNVQFANENNSQVIDDYGSTLFSNRVCYLKAKVSYTGRKTGTYELIEKIICPDGTVLHSNSSPDNATQSFVINSSSGRDAMFEFCGMGWDEPGSYEVGRWKFEIWYEDILVYSTTFDIQ